MSKFPAKTRTEIEALPPSDYRTTFGPLAITKWGDLTMVQFQGYSLTPQQAVERGVVVTARLVDPAPLEALLRCLLGITHKVAGWSVAIDIAELEEQYPELLEIEAALEGNDG